MAETAKKADLGAHETSLYPRVLGPAYAALPLEIRAMHDFRRELRAEGVCDIDWGRWILARLATRALGFPLPGHDLPARVRYVADGTVELLERTYGTHSMSTRQRLGAGRDNGFLIERFGPATMALEIVATPAGIDHRVRRLWIWGVRAPLWLAPRLTATERVVDGWYRFDVRIGLPLIGTVIHYRGRLRPVAAE